MDLNLDLARLKGYIHSLKHNANITQPSICAHLFPALFDVNIIIVIANMINDPHDYHQPSSPHDNHDYHDYHDHYDYHQLTSPPSGIAASWTGTGSVCVYQGTASYQSQLSQPSYQFFRRRRREIKLTLGRGRRGLGKRYFDVDC